MCDNENYEAEEESLFIEMEPDLKSGKKYGKLWEFIRDLLQIERFNPRIIK